MLSFISVVTILIFPSLAVTAPVTGGFVVSQVPAASAQRQHPAELIVKTLKRHGVQPSEHVRLAAQRASVTATPEPFDVKYLCPVSIGGQQVLLDFDSGSSDLWVQSRKSAGPGQQYYDPHHSSTAHHVKNASWHIQYADGSAAWGNVYTDEVSVGNLTVANQGVELAGNTTSNFKYDAADGVLGLSFEKINTVKPKKQTTFFSNAAPSLQSKVFTADLKHNANGTYTFGYIDPSQYDGPITYAPVDDSYGYWNFSSEAWSVGCTRKNDSIWGIADTGTTLLLAGNDIVQGYYAEVPSSYYNTTIAGFMFDCSEELPDFTLTINDHAAVIPGASMNWGDYGSAGCFGSLQWNGDLGFAVWGDIFFKSQFVVFDPSKSPRLGFAAKAA